MHAVSVVGPSPKESRHHSRVVSSSLMSTKIVAVRISHPLRQGAFASVQKKKSDWLHLCDFAGSRELFQRLRFPACAHTGNRSILCAPGRAFIYCIFEDDERRRFRRQDDRSKY